MASELNLEIVTPFGILLNSKIISCTVPGTRGEFQVLQHHAALMSTVEIGSVKVEYTDAKSAKIAVSGGFCEVKNDRVKIMVESAESADHIDTERAKAAKRRAEERLSSKSADIDYDRAKLAMVRALNRLKVAGRN